MAVGVVAVFVGVVVRQLVAVLVDAIVVDLGGGGVDGGVGVVAVGAAVVCGVLAILVGVVVTGPITVTIHAVVVDLGGGGVDGGIGVVAVGAAVAVGVLAVFVGVVVRQLVAVLVDAVVVDLGGTRVDGAVVVVAVGAAADIGGVVAVAIDVGEVGAITVVVDAVVGDLGAAGVDGGVGVVAVGVVGAVAAGHIAFEHRAAAVAVAIVIGVGVVRGRIAGSRAIDGAVAVVVYAVAHLGGAGVDAGVVVVAVDVGVLAIAIRVDQRAVGSTVGTDVGGRAVRVLVGGVSGVDEGGGGGEGEVVVRAVAVEAVAVEVRIVGDVAVDGGVDGVAGGVTAGVEVPVVVVEVRVVVGVVVDVDPATIDRVGDDVVDERGVRVVHVDRATAGVGVVADQGVVDELVVVVVRKVDGTAAVVGDVFLEDVVGPDIRAAATVGVVAVDRTTLVGAVLAERTGRDAHLIGGVGVEGTAVVAAVGGIGCVSQERTSGDGEVVGGIRVDRTTVVVRFVVGKGRVSNQQIIVPTRGVEVHCTAVSVGGGVGVEGGFIERQSAVVVAVDATTAGVGIVVRQLDRRQAHVGVEVGMNRTTITAIRLVIIERYSCNGRGRVGLLEVDCTTITVGVVVVEGGIGDGQRRVVVAVDRTAVAVGRIVSGERDIVQAHLGVAVAV